MSFGNDNVKHAIAHIADPGATGKKILLFKAPHRISIRSATIASSNAQGAGSAGNYELQNFGTAGTAIKSGAAGTIAAAKGGTASADRFAANTPVAFTIGKPDVAEGEYVYCAYTETGDFVEGLVTIDIAYVDGLGGASG